MSVGKLNNDILNQIVLGEIHAIRDDILIRPSVGEDCGAIDFGEFACVLTTDPITGSASNIGRLAVHVCLNDIASSGSTPIGLMLTLLCPEGTKNEEIQEILREANETANSVGVEIIGGHTEITNAVNRMIISATAIGKVAKEKLIRTRDAQVGDYIYLTKSAGLEGTAIIATDNELELKDILSAQELKRAKEMFNDISVVKEGEIGVKSEVSAMHDATEGGVLGAIHELCEASGKGCKVKKALFNIDPVTEKICDHYHIDPLKLISSGSMVMCIEPKKAGFLERELMRVGIEYSRVGFMTESDEIKLVFGNGGGDEIFEFIESPEADELYKVT